MKQCIVRVIGLSVCVIVLLALLFPTALPQNVVYAQGPDGSGQAPPLLPPLPPSSSIPQVPRGPRWTDFQAAEFVLGQAVFTTNGAGMTASTMNMPEKPTIDPATNKVFVSDSANNRVLRFASWSSLVNGAAAEAVLGQALFTTNATACSPNGMNTPIGVWVDSDGRLWVGDYINHRVLRYDNASTKASGANADAVLGQPDFTTCKSGTMQNKMFAPGDVQVDSAGRLWVVEWANNRVLRFDSAAAKPNGANANGVLGQANFTSNGTATTQSGMNNPTALVIDNSGNLYVGENGNNRVLRFNSAAGKANGANADAVFGQPNFTSNAYGITATGLGSVYGVTTDQYGRLYVSDAGNNRILIYTNAASAGNGAAASNVLGQPDLTSKTANKGGLSASSLNAPLRLFFDNAGKRLWVADVRNNRVLRYLEVAIATTTAVVCMPNPSTVGQTVTCTATITGNVPVTPGGTMTFNDGNNPITGCTNMTVAGNTVQCTTNALPAGAHNITATYNGDATFSASTSPVFAQTVNAPVVQPTATPAAPKEVPEGDTLLLLGGGMSGLGLWLRYQWNKRRKK